MIKRICTFLISMCLVSMTFLLSSCAENKLYITEDSFFSDFEIQDGKVYVYCTLYVENHTGTEKTVEFKASFDDDVKNNLLETSVLSGYSLDESTQHFVVKEGKNYIEVVFVGNHAGGVNKHDKNLPPIEIIEIK